jgi:hypothetical protein
MQIFFHLYNLFFVGDEAIISFNCLLAAYDGFIAVILLLIKEVQM